MISVNVVYRPSTKQGRYPGSLSLRIVHRRRNKTATLTGCHLFDEEWNRELQHIVYPFDNPARAGVLEDIEARIEEAKNLLAGFISMLEKRGRYSVDDVVQLFRERKDENKLSGYTGLLADHLEKRGQSRTARAYRTVTRGLIKFNKGIDIPLYQINSCLIKEYELYLKEHGRAPNTVSYYMRNLRAIYNKAVAEKRVVRSREGNPFDGVYTGVTATSKRALTLEELKKLYNLDLTALLKKTKPDSPRYNELKNIYTAQRYFTFCFNARGMCFIDLAYLQKSNIRGGILKYVRKKTGKQIEVKLTAEMEVIIESFSGETIGSPYVFPVIQNPENSLRLQYETGLRIQNLRLKHLAKLAGIPKCISTHWARHSWATIGKQENIPLWVISECLGHTSERTTQIYLGQLDNSLLDAANKRVTSAVLHRRQSAETTLSAGV